MEDTVYLDITVPTGDTKLYLVHENLLPEILNANKDGSVILIQSSSDQEDECLTLNPVSVLSDGEELSNLKTDTKCQQEKLQDTMTDSGDAYAECVGNSDNDQTVPNKTSLKTQNKCTGLSLLDLAAAASQLEPINVSKNTSLSKESLSDHNQNLSDTGKTEDATVSTGNGRDNSLSKPLVPTTETPTPKELPLCGSESVEPSKDVKVHIGNSIPTNTSSSESCSVSVDTISDHDYSTSLTGTLHQTVPLVVEALEDTDSKCEEERLSVSEFEDDIQIIGESRNIPLLQAQPDTMWSGSALAMAFRRLNSLYTCSACRSSFEALELIKKHINTNHWYAYREGPYVCKECLVMSDSSKQFKRHVKHHHASEHPSKLIPLKILQVIHSRLIIPPAHPIMPRMSHATEQQTTRSSSYKGKQLTLGESCNQGSAIHSLTQPTSTIHHEFQPPLHYPLSHLRPISASLEALNKLPNSHLSSSTIFQNSKEPMEKPGSRSSTPFNSSPMSPQSILSSPSPQSLSNFSQKPRRNFSEKISPVMTLPNHSDVEETQLCFEKPITSDSNQNDDLFLAQKDQKESKLPNGHLLSNTISHSGKLPLSKPRSRPSTPCNTPVIPESILSSSPQSLYHFSMKAKRNSSERPLTVMTSSDHPDSKQNTFDLKTSTSISISKDFIDSTHLESLTNVTNYLIESCIRNESHLSKIKDTKFRNTGNSNTGMQTFITHNVENASKTPTLSSEKKSNISKAGSKQPSTTLATSSPSLHSQFDAKANISTQRQYPLVPLGTHLTTANSFAGSVPNMLSASSHVKKDIPSISPNTYPLLGPLFRLPASTLVHTHHHTLGAKLPVHMDKSILVTHPVTTLANSFCTEHSNSVHVLHGPQLKAQAEQNEHIAQLSTNAFFHQRPPIQTIQRTGSSPSVRPILHTPLEHSSHDDYLTIKSLLRNNSAVNSDVGHPVLQNVLTESPGVGNSENTQTCSTRINPIFETNKFRPDTTLDSTSVLQKQTENEKSNKTPSRKNKRNNSTSSSDIHTHSFVDITNISQGEKNMNDKSKSCLGQKSVCIAEGCYNTEKMASNGQIMTHNDQQLSVPEVHQSSQGLLEDSLEKTHKDQAPMPSEIHNGLKEDHQKKNSSFQECFKIYIQKDVGEYPINDANGNISSYFSSQETVSSLSKKETSKCQTSDATIFPVSKINSSGKVNEANTKSLLEILISDPLSCDPNSKLLSVNHPLPNHLGHESNTKQKPSSNQLGAKNNKILQHNGKKKRPTQVSSGVDCPVVKRKRGRPKKDNQAEKPKTKQTPTRKRNEVKKTMDKPLYEAHSVGVMKTIIKKNSSSESEIVQNEEHTPNMSKYCTETNIYIGCNSPTRNNLAFPTETEEEIAVSNIIKEMNDEDGFHTDGVSHAVNSSVFSLSDQSRLTDVLASSQKEDGTSISHLRNRMCSTNIEHPTENLRKEVTNNLTQITALDNRNLIEDNRQSKPLQLCANKVDKGDQEQTLVRNVKLKQTTEDSPSNLKQTTRETFELQRQTSLKVIHMYKHFKEPIQQAHKNNQLQCIQDHNSKERAKIPIKKPPCEITLCNDAVSQTKEFSQAPREEHVTEMLQTQVGDTENPFSEDKSPTDNHQEPGYYHTLVKETHSASNNVLKELEEVSESQTDIESLFVCREIQEQGEKKRHLMEKVTDPDKEETQNELPSESYAAVETTEIRTLSQADEIHNQSAKTKLNTYDTLKPKKKTAEEAKVETEVTDNTQVINDKPHPEGNKEFETCGDQINDVLQKDTSMNAQHNGKDISETHEKNVKLCIANTPRNKGNITESRRDSCNSHETREEVSLQPSPASSESLPDLDGFDFSNHALSSSANNGNRTDDISNIARRVFDACPADMQAKVIRSLSTEKYKSVISSDEDDEVSCKEMSNSQGDHTDNISRRTQKFKMFLKQAGRLSDTPQTSQRSAKTGPNEKRKRKMRNSVDSREDGTSAKLAKAGVSLKEVISLSGDAQYFLTRWQKRCNSEIQDPSNDDQTSSDTNGTLSSMYPLSENRKDGFNIDKSNRLPQSLEHKPQPAEALNIVTNRLSKTTESLGSLAEHLALLFDNNPCATVANNNNSSTAVKEKSKDFVKCQENDLNTLGLKNKCMMTNKVGEMNEVIFDEYPSSEEDKNVTYKCFLCHFKHKERIKLQEHCRIHIKLKPYKCSICNFRVQSNKRMSSHLKVHGPKAHTNVVERDLQLQKKLIERLFGQFGSSFDSKRNIFEKELKPKCLKFLHVSTLKGSSVNYKMQCKVTQSLTPDCITREKRSVQNLADQTPTSWDALHHIITKTNPSQQSLDKEETKNPKTNINKEILMKDKSGIFSKLTKILQPPNAKNKNGENHIPENGASSYWPEEEYTLSPLAPPKVNNTVQQAYLALPENQKTKCTKEIAHVSNSTKFLHQDKSPNQKRFRPLKIFGKSIYQRFTALKAIHKSERGIDLSKAATDIENDLNPDMSEVIRNDPKLSMKPVVYLKQV